MYQIKLTGKLSKTKNRDVKFLSELSFKIGRILSKRPVQNRIRDLNFDQGIKLVRF